MKESNTANKLAPELETMLTPEDMKGLFKVDLATLLMWRREYGLPYFRVRRNVRFLPSAVKEWLHTHHGPENSTNQPKARA